MYCRCLRHACAFAADPSVDKEQSFIGGFRCFKRCPLHPGVQISQCRSLCVGCSCNFVPCVLRKSKLLTTSRTRSRSVCSVDELHGDTCYALMHCGTLFMVQARDAVSPSQQSALLVRNAVFFWWRQCLQDTRRFSKGRGV